MVKNGSGMGEDGLCGRADFLYMHVDTTRISIRNYAIVGRSSRTFIVQGIKSMKGCKLKKYLL